ncbi:MAG TPA: HD domain-containing protein [Candidatus Paceibacterota bacterium]|nr:HD domain-containing protein [Candidatus Paceibacterota bacterium]HRZ29775.1 HD domain-containing protein [Candidatus Paceibacterota bacterium]
MTTSAQPQDIQKIFKKSIYENNFGTVGILTGAKENNLKIVEVTTYRLESNYLDKRHPENIKFADDICDDLMRRDFTINAMAFKIDSVKILKTKVKAEGDLIDLYNGQDDLSNGLIRAVRDPNERFGEDALRMLRAMRLTSQLNFKIEKTTALAIKLNAKNLKFVSSERIRDEFIKILMSSAGAKSIVMLEESGLLEYIIPELIDSIGVGQNLHHIYTVYEHLINSFDYAVKQNFSLEVRLAALLHDIAKPIVKKGNGKNSTFYNHEMVGAKMVKRILERLKFPNYILDKVVLLVRNHQFYYDPEINTDSSIRYLLTNVKKENILELSQLREADRIGSGCPKALPFRLRHFLFRVEKVLNELENKNLSLKTLKINGDKLMKLLDIKPGPRLGFILNILLSEVIGDIKVNTVKYLNNRAKELNCLDDLKLKDLNDKSKEIYKQLMLSEEEKIKTKYKVR